MGELSQSQNGKDHMFSFMETGSLVWKEPAGRARLETKRSRGMTGKDG